MVSSSSRARSQREPEGLGFRVWGLGFRVWGLGFEVWGLGWAQEASGVLWGLGWDLPPYTRV